MIKSSFDPIGGALASREDGLYTLQDFGYEDINLEGAFHQKTYFSIRQPDGILGGPDSYFEVHFRHSDALVGDTSMLTVYFDGVPASSIQLSRGNVDDGKLRVKIPREVLDKGSFEITVDVYNYLGNIDCSKDWYDVAWYITKHVPLDLAHLVERAKESAPEADVSTPEKVSAAFDARIDAIDFENARADVEPYVMDRSELDIWSAEFFRQMVRMIKFLPGQSSL